MERNLRSAGLALAAIVTVTLGSASSALAQGAPGPAPDAAPAPSPGPGNTWTPSPAVAADPPILPPPSPGAPTSTSGTDVAPPSNQAPMGPLAVTDKDARSAAEDARAKMSELEARIALDEARLKTLERDLGPLRHLKVQGYVQAQYRLQSFNAAASPNLIGGRLPPGIGSNDVIAKADGTTTNTNMFRLRRTRLRTIYETDILRVFLQLDMFPTGGPTATEGTIARNAEVTGIANWTKDVKTELTAGLFQVPFLGEVIESSMTRPWIERTQTSLQMFPSERDLGVHAKTIVNKGLFAFDFGVVNGQHVGEKLFVLDPDLNGSKDLFAMASSKLGPLTGYLSGYLGRGQTVDPQQLRVKNWDRRGASVGIAAAHAIAPKLGESKVMAALTFGTNMDTGITYPFALPAIPANFTDDVKDLNQRGLFVRAEQELTRWALVGFRYDTYTPQSGLANNGRDTYALMAGLRFSKHLRLINEASYAIDNVHPEGASAPSKHIAGYTAWMQGTF